MIVELVTLLATCGPDFPERLLEDRTRTMTELVAGSFKIEAAHLAHADFAYPVVEETEPRDAREHGLDRERALYDDGARAWKRGDAAAAERTWRKLLALPAAERHNRSTWAAFMLGHATHDAKWFALTRKLARDGFDDELGLAATSLGDEARLDLVARNDAAAVQLYAQQAALGSTSGYASLLMVARALVHDEARLAKSLRDPIVQRLVATYLFTRGVDEIDPTSSTKLLRTLDALSLDHDVAGMDRLAAAAYRAGQYDLAAKLVAKASSGLASWVKAKLALRAGDRQLAADWLTMASSQFSQDEWWSQSGTMLGIDELAPKTRIDGERAILALNHGKYDAALALFLEGGQSYWLDAAWVAERAMTLDELIKFVDAHDAQPIARDAKRDPWDVDVRARLRSLLARRLVRETRIDDAIRYFDDVDARVHARQLGDAAARVFTGSDQVAGAQARFDAAVIVRRHGLAIMGTELDPDWAVFDGNYDLGRYAAVDGAHPRPAFVGAEEAARASSSAAVPNERFHYRAIAASLANNAADNLPPKSQAFAAVLCRATSWLIERQPDEAERFWLRYVKEGAPVDFSSSFGRDCPAPDFAAARSPRTKRATPRTSPTHPLRKRTAARDAALMLGLVAFTSLAARAISRRRASIPIASPPP